MAKKDKIRAIYKRVGFDPVEVEINNDLETLQQMIGGYIETIPWYQDTKTVLICDEEGKINGRPANFAYMGDVIAGSALWVGTKRDNFVDCPYTLTTFRLKWPWFFEEG